MKYMKTLKISISCVGYIKSKCILKQYFLMYHNNMKREGIVICKVVMY